MAYFQILFPEIPGLYASPVVLQTAAEITAKVVKGCGNQSVTLSQVRFFVPKTAVRIDTLAKVTVL